MDKAAHHRAVHNNEGETPKYVTNNRESLNKYMEYVVLAS